MIELKEFQKQAADQIAERFARYYDEPPMRGTKKNLRVVPFFQSLDSITASGKTEPAWVLRRLQTLERLELWNRSTPHRSGTHLS